MKAHYFPSKALSQALLSIHGAIPGTTLHPRPYHRHYFPTTALSQALLSIHDHIAGTTFQPRRKAREKPADSITLRDRLNCSQTLTQRVTDLRG
ncbi:Hypothetical predicted protein [Pelobates cultripes]|uniref:Uncharacterized protein n=1 Tax=Pelobates cultripes TaxID=61616 RepID=A0AAD1SWS8_PELCU|nr:Hypothetical predicted protein [Pelobates cultripes]